MSSLAAVTALQGGRGMPARQVRLVLGHPEGEGAPGHLPQALAAPTGGS